MKWIIHLKASLRIIHLIKVFFQNNLIKNVTLKVDVKINQLLSNFENYRWYLLKMQILRIPSEDNVY